MHDDFTEKTLKESIRHDFKRFRELNDLKSTWQEREDVVDLAYRIIKEDMLLERDIDRKYEKYMEDARRKMQDGIKIYLLFRQDFDRIDCGDFVDIVIKYGAIDNIEHILYDYLKNNNKETTLTDEENMIKRARQIVHKHVMTPSECNQSFEDECKELREWKRKKIELSKVVNEKIMESKFKKFFYEFENEKLKKENQDNS